MSDFAWILIGCILCAILPWCFPALIQFLDAVFRRG